MQEKQREKSLVKQNILQYLDYKGISDYKFYKDTGVSRGVLSQNNGLSEENLTRFLAYAPDINLNWLLTGEGNMLKSDVDGSLTSASLSDVDLSKLIASRMEKKMLDMYSEGRIFSREAVERIINMHQKELAEAQKKIGKLEEELNRLNLLMEKGSNSEQIQNLE